MSRLVNSSTLGGIALLIFGTIYLFVGSNYALGTLRSMGAGYFPMLLGWLIVVTGALIVLRGVIQGGHKIAVAWRPLLAISASIAAFGIVMPFLGLFPAVLACVALSATAESPILPRRIGMLSVFLCAIGYFVFVVTLGMPMQLLRMP